MTDFGPKPAETRRVNVAVTPRRELDKMRCAECGDAHQGGLFDMKPSCHPDAGVRMQYILGAGIILASCHECGGNQVAFELAPDKRSVQ